MILHVFHQFETELSGTRNVKTRKPSDRFANRRSCLCIYPQSVPTLVTSVSGVLIMFTSALNCSLIRCTIPFQRQVLGRVTPEISGKIYSVVSKSFHRYTHFVSSGYFKQTLLLNAEIGREKHNLYPNHIRLINKLI